MRLIPAWFVCRNAAQFAARTGIHPKKANPGNSWHISHSFVWESVLPFPIRRMSANPMQVKGGSLELIVNMKGTIKQQNSSIVNKNNIIKSFRSDVAAIIVEKQNHIKDHNSKRRTAGNHQVASAAV